MCLSFCTLLYTLGCLTYCTTRYVDRESGLSEWMKSRRQDERLHSEIYKGVTMKPRRKYRATKSENSICATTTCHYFISIPSTFVLFAMFAMTKGNREGRTTSTTSSHRCTTSTSTSLFLRLNVNLLRLRLRCAINQHSIIFLV